MRSGRFDLFRIGDAVASRNIHAAIYEAFRFCISLVRFHRDRDHRDATEVDKDIERKLQCAIFDAIGMAHAVSMKAQCWGWRTRCRQRPGSRCTATRGNKKMKMLLASTVLAVGLLGLGGAASAAECGDVTIANMNWQSAEVAANIDKLILEAGLAARPNSLSATRSRP
jgi:hypothetical protein